MDERSVFGCIMYRAYLLIVLLVSLTICGIGCSKSPVRQEVIRAIAADSSGCLYVLRLNRRTVQKFDASGRSIAVIGLSSTGHGRFGVPEALAVGLSGEIYVLDSENCDVWVFDSSGVYVTQWKVKKGYSLSGIAVDARGQVSIVDGRADVVWKYDACGRFVDKWGAEGIANGQFVKPLGIASAPKGDVYVVETKASFFSVDRHVSSGEAVARIQRFSENGVLVGIYGMHGIGKLQVPIAIAVDHNGYCYILDNSEVKKFDRLGRFVLSWGGRGQGIGQFWNAVSVAVDGRGHVYVADSSDGRIQEFDTSGKFIAQRYVK